MKENGYWKSFRSALKWLDPFTYVDLYLLPKINPSKNEIVNWIVYLVSAFVFAFLIYQIAAFALNTPSPMVIVVSGSMEPNLYRGDVVVLHGISALDLKSPEVQLNEIATNKSLGEIANLVPGNANNQFNVSEIRFNNGVSVPIAQTGDIVVYHSPLRNQQIIHRSVAKIVALDGTFLITKGDNFRTNKTVDQDCGTIVQNVYPGTDISYISTEKSCITPYPIDVKSIDGIAWFKIPWIGHVKLLLFDDLPRILLGRSATV